MDARGSARTCTPRVSVPVDLDSNFSGAGDPSAVHPVSEDGALPITGVIRERRIVPTPPWITITYVGENAACD
jgi:hypothetical protein